MDGTKELIPKNIITVDTELDEFSNRPVANSTLFKKFNESAGMQNPMTAAGDIIIGGTSGTPTRLAKGTAGQVLKMNSGGTSPEWGAVPDELPTIASGDAGKVLTVNAGETGAEWAAPSSGGGDLWVHQFKIFSEGLYPGQVLANVLSHNENYDPHTDLDLVRSVSVMGYIKSDNVVHIPWNITFQNNVVYFNATSTDGHDILGTLPVMQMLNSFTYKVI